MESSPLTQAYDHAQAASLATQASDNPAAITAHTLAAGEFSRAADTTTSPEALRTLALLAAHHTTLSTLLRSPSPPATSAIIDADLATTTEKNVSTSAAVAELRGKNDAGATTTTTAAVTSSRRTPPSSSLHTPRRMPPRELSSSIASNLASARGIRTPHSSSRALSPGVTAAHAPGSLEAPRRPPSRDKVGAATGPSWLPPVSHDHITERAQTSRLSDRNTVVTTEVPKATQATKEADEGFNRFYSTFEGLLSKLSAPLAFAGLPLITEEPPSTAPSKAPSPAASTLQPLPTAPELSKYISRAALRASASNPANADSFYVVPATGGTASYASILSFAEKERRRESAREPSFDTTDDDFVDAREHPSPPSPVKNRSFAISAAAAGRTSPTATTKSARGAGRDGGGAVSVLAEREREELSIENRSLKACIDHLSKRLHAFEAAAQSSTLALHESMRMYRPSSPAAAVAAGSGGASSSAHTPADAASKPSTTTNTSITVAGPAPAATSTKAQTVTAAPAAIENETRKDQSSAVAAAAAAAAQRAQTQIQTLESRIAALESQMAADARTRRALEGENEKLKGVLGRYRERWERLKEGAKSRRAEGEGKGGGGG